MTMPRLEALAICSPAHHSIDDELALKHPVQLQFGLEGNHSFSQNRIESAMQSLCPQCAHTPCMQMQCIQRQIKSPARTQSPSVQSTALYTRSSLHVLATADRSQVTMHAPLQLCLLGCLLAEVCRQCLVHFQQN